MRTVCSLLTAVLLLGASLLAANAHAQSRTVQRTVDLDRDGSVSVSTFSGAVNVTTWDRASAEVKVRVDGETQESVDRTEIRIDGGGARLDIEADFDDVNESDWSRSTDVPDTDITIRMPQSAELETKVFSADVTVAGLDGDLEVNAFSGRIEVDGIGGELRVDVYSGDLTATGVRGPVRYSSFSGDADVSMDVLGEDCSFSTFSGDATVTLARSAAFDLRADTGMSGSLRADFDVDDLRTDDGYRGAINGGGPRLEFDTFSGDFRLRAN
jgi:DUF4097 and DUF4098 domain-containing protein YvlB